MDADSIRSAVVSSVSAYIYHRWLQELGDRIEENAVTADDAVRLEKEVRDYVVYRRGMVEVQSFLHPKS